MMYNMNIQLPIRFTAMEVDVMNKIRYTFDYQKFSPSSRLTAMVEDVERRYPELTDEDLFFVAAAGESYRMGDENGNPDRNTR